MYELTVNENEMELLMNFVDGKSVSKMDEFSNKYQCNILVNMDCLFIIYDSLEMKNNLLNDVKRYLSENEIKNYEFFDEEKKHLLKNKEFDELILQPLRNYGQNINIDIIENENGSKIHMSGNCDDIQYAFNILHDFCEENISSFELFIDDETYLKSMCKGNMIVNYLKQFANVSYPGIFFWLDSNARCIWSSIIPQLGNELEIESMVVSEYNHLQENEEIEIEGKGVETQREIFERFADFAKNVYFLSLLICKKYQINRI